MKKLNNLLKTTTLALTVLLTTNTANALDVGGLKLGVGPKLTLSMNKADIGNVGSSSYGFGWGFGAVSVLDLEPVALELGLNYSERRFGLKNLGGSAGDYAATLKQIEIPFLAYYKHSLDEAMALRAGAGAQIELGVGKVKGDEGSVSYSDAGISKNSYSLLFDIGGDYKLAELGTLTVDLRYALGLKDRSESNGLLFNDKFKTQYVEVAAAFLF